MLTDEEAKKYAREILEWCDGRYNFSYGCISCPFNPNGYVDCIGTSLRSVENIFEDTNG